jgi:hypothetical protein
MSTRLTIILVAIALLTGFCACATSSEEDAIPSFRRHTLTTAADGAIHAVTADLGDDGDADILTANFYDGTITLWDALGSGAFSAQIVARDFEGVRNVYAHDLDADGDRDIVACAFYDGEVAWWENTAGGEWSKHLLTESMPGANTVFPGDLDGDGDPDIIAGSWDQEGAGNDQIAWFENDGTGSFTEHLISETSDRISSLVVTDLDGDSEADIVCADYGNDRITWLEYSGGSYTFTSLTSGFNGCHWAWPHDLDGDGDMDIAGAAYEGGAVAWLENDGTGSFTRHPVDTAVNLASHVHIGDVDGDGRADILATGGNPGALYWWKYASGRWQRHVITASLAQPLSVWAADLDGDGDTDIVGTDYTSDLCAWWENR